MQRHQFVQLLVFGDEEQQESIWNDISICDVFILAGRMPSLVKNF